MRLRPMNGPATSSLRARKTTDKDSQENEPEKKHEGWRDDVGHWVVAGAYVAEPYQCMAAFRHGTYRDDERPVSIKVSRRSQKQGR
jgi:hypothetical protein